LIRLISHKLPASSAVGQLLMTAASVALAAYAAWLWILFFPSFHHPVALLDSMVDFAFVAHPRSALEFVFEHHNEHVIAITRAASLVDMRCCGLRYGVHQAIALVALATTIASLGALVFVNVPSWTTRIGGCAAIAAILLAPCLMPVAAFPYFLQHLLITPLQVGCAFFAYRLALGESGNARQLANAAATIFFALLCLVTGGSGIVVALLAIALPPLMLKVKSSSRWLSHALIAALLVALWVIAVRPYATGDTIFGALAQPMQSFVYFLRILGAPAYFAWPNSSLGPVAGILLLAAAFGAVALTAIHRRRFPLLAIVCAALILGHLASVALAAVARSSLAGAAAETPKYAYYTYVIIAASLVICFAAGVHREAAKLAGLAAGVLLALLAMRSTSVFVAEREFFRTTETLEYALAQSIEVPQTRTLLAASSPAILVKLVALLETARERNLNFFSAPPFKLIGQRLQGAATLGCQGSVDAKDTLETRDGAAAVELTGWAFASAMGRNRSVLVVVDDTVVGAGEFTTVRPDVVANLSLHISAFTPIEWRAFAPVAASAPIRIGIYDRDSGETCLLPAS